MHTCQIHSMQLDHTTRPNEVPQNPVMILRPYMLCGRVDKMGKYKWHEEKNFWKIKFQKEKVHGFQDMVERN